MTAILLKEIKSYFKSLFGWIYLAVFTFFAGAYFVGNNIQYGSPYIRDSLSPMVIVVIFILPLLTMRIIAEEKRQKTDQFLITAPISLVEVIIGKFLALCAIMLVSTLIIAIGVLIMSFYGTTPWVENLYSLLGFFLFGCECIAIGMFLSSITEHQFLAAIFTYTVYIFTLIVPGFCTYIFGADKAISKVLNVTDIYAPFDGMLSGVVDFNDLIYIFSVIAIFLVLSYKVFAKNSVQVSAVGKNKYFLSTLIPVIIIVAIVGINIGCSYIPTKYMEHDITKNGWYTITDETKNVLASLDQDINIYVLASPEDVDETVKHYVDSYDSESSHIKVKYKPTSQFPGFASQYTDASLYYSSLIIEMGEESRVVDYNDMFQYTYDYMTGGYSITGFDVEGQITAAISSLINGDNKIKVYCVQGHEEIPMSAYITDTLKKANYVFQDCYLIGKDVPEDCDILVINGPQSDFDKTEVETVKNYIDNGGKVIMMAAFELYDTPNYDSLIEYLGIDVTDGTVLERNYGYLITAEDRSAILMIPTTDSPFTVGSSKMNFIYRARGLKYDAENIPADTSITDIFVTSKESYAKVLGQTISAEYESGDEEGPFPVGVYVRKRNQETGELSDVIVIGSGLFLYEDIDNMVSHGNSDLFIDVSKNIVDNSLIVTIPAKELSYEYITVSTGVVLVYAVVCCVIIPLAFIITGIVILIVRRRK